MVSESSTFTGRRRQQWTCRRVLVKIVSNLEKGKQAGRAQLNLHLSLPIPLGLQGETGLISK